MPILLDTPFQFSPGHARPIEPYNEVKIIRLSIDTNLKELKIVAEYGNTVNQDGYSSVWISGRAEINQIIIEDRSAHLGPGGVEVPEDLAFSILVGTAVTTDAGVSLYNDVALKLYQYLIDQGFYEGTIT